MGSVTVGKWAQSVMVHQGPETGSDVVLVKDQVSTLISGGVPTLTYSTSLHFVFNTEVFSLL